MAPDIGARHDDSNHATHAQRPARLLTLTLLNTLAASLIWGINTLFLLDAGLDATAAFAANACFTAGMVLFEVPTGVVADTWGQRTSYLLGALTLAAATVLYWLAWPVQAPFWAWAVTSVLLGLGFAFFSGATEAWLVDALKFTGFEGDLESVFSRAQVMTGAGMLTGRSPAADRAVDEPGRALPAAGGGAGGHVPGGLEVHARLGVHPRPGGRPGREARTVLQRSLRHGFGNPPVRWMMLSAPFVQGVVLYAGYAMQPYLLELYGDRRAYGVAGLAAAIFAGAQIAGGAAASRIRRLFRRRTSALLAGVLASCGALTLLGVTTSFWVAVALLVAWALLFAATVPIRQAYLNGLIPSEQRATVLSFDNLLGSSGGVVIQPALGGAADAWSYPTSLLAGAAVQLLAAPFVALACRRKTASDPIQVPNPAVGEPAAPLGAEQAA
jgi:MFS family permease